MTELTIGERARLVRLSADHARARAASRLLRSPLLRWTYGAPVADELVIIPQDLRTADSTFAAELAHGQIGLAGHVATLQAGSPFDVTAPSPAWARELHGFSWLRHLRAANTAESRRLALDLVANWIAREHGRSAIACEPAVTARRLMSWIVNGDFLLADVGQETYDRTTDTIAAELIALSASWRQAPAGIERLVALTGLLYGNLCVAGHRHRLAQVADLFAGEIDRQILPDGGHVSRNPGVLVELLLDLLPLRQCFATREEPVPAAVEPVITRMLSFVRFMRLGDSSLARFNGMGASPHDAIATVLAYGEGAETISADARSSRYVRLQQGGLVVLMDVGRPPPLEMAGLAHAGCLSFEMSAGPHALFVNAGAPGPADEEWRAAARSTAAHNTLCLAASSSARLVRDQRLERMLGAAPIRGPTEVRARTLRDGDGDGAKVEAAHDGYRGRSGLIHFRRLELDATGRKLTGIDRLGPASGTLRLERDLPFAIHFHLHPDVAWVAKPGEIELTLRNGDRWRFTVTGAAPSIEESVLVADSAGPRAGHQIVLRSATFGETEVAWAVERIGR